MSIQLTTLSAYEYEHIRSGEMTPAMASEYLREDRISLRSFGEILQEIYPAPDLALRLIAAFSVDDSNTRSITKKINNWISGKNKPTRREDVFRIAFALDLSEAQANYLLGQCTEYGIHYRDGRDVVYAWFLRNDRGYTEAREFFQSLPPCPRYADFPLNANTHITQEVQNAFLAIHTVEELREYYTANLNQFGVLHVRAYQYFRGYLDQLIHPAAPWDGAPEADYSLEAIMDRYLSLQMPSGKDRSSYNTTQKLIKRNWPNATALKNIRNHKEDVPRKLLLLLYVITENSIGGEYRELDEEYLTLQERLEDHWWVLNAILTDCGMPTLDPRNASDWLILYAVTASEDESMSERMEKVISQVFADLPNEKQ